MEEVWKDVVGYEMLYKVSSFGRIVSLPKIMKTPTTQYLTKTREITQKKDKGGYFRVGLTKDGVRRQHFVHRLVAEAFLGVNRIMTVNHKDEDKSNNHVENLEYMTRAENVRYGTGVKRASKSRMENPYNAVAVNQYTTDGRFVARYKSGMDAIRALGKMGCSSGIVECCRREHHTAFGYVWRFDGDVDTSFTKSTNARAVVRCDLNGNPIQEFPSLEAASNKCKVSKAHICDCCRGNRAKAGGSKWKYKDNVK